MDERYAHEIHVASIDARLNSQMLSEKSRSVALVPQLPHSNNGKAARDSVDAEQDALFSYEGTSYSEIGLVLPPGLPFEVWDSWLTTLFRINRGIQWGLGDCLNYGEAAYGEMYTQAMAVSGKAYDTLTHYKDIASCFPHSVRRPALSFEHHAAVASIMRKHPSVAMEILDRAEEDHLTTREVRYDAMQARIDLGMQPPTDEPGPPEYDRDDVDPETGEIRGSRASQLRPGDAVIDQAGPSVDWLDDLLDIVQELAYADPSDAQELRMIHFKASEWVHEKGLSPRPTVVEGEYREA